MPSASEFKHASRTKSWEEWNFAASSHCISLCAELTKIFWSQHWEPPLPPNLTLRPTLRNPLRGLRVPLVMHVVRVRFPCALVSARSFFFLACVHRCMFSDDTEFGAFKSGVLDVRTISAQTILKILASPQSEATGHERAEPCLL